MPGTAKVVFRKHTKEKFNQDGQTRKATPKAMCLKERERGKNCNRVQEEGKGRKRMKKQR